MVVSPDSSRCSEEATHLDKANQADEKEEFLNLTTRLNAHIFI